MRQQQKKTITDNKEPIKIPIYFAPEKTAEIKQRCHFHHIHIETYTSMVIYNGICHSKYHTIHHSIRNDRPTDEGLGLMIKISDGYRARFQSTTGLLANTRGLLNDYLSKQKSSI